MTAPSGSVFVFCPKAVVQAATALGVDDGELLRDAGIDPLLLRSPGERIPLSNYLHLYRLALERSGEFQVYDVIHRADCSVAQPAPPREVAQLAS